MTRNEFDDLLCRVSGTEGFLPEVGALEALLRSDTEEEKERLFSLARDIRNETSGKRIVLRGLIEFSNGCKNTCFYCGLNRTNNSLGRYRLSPDEIFESVQAIEEQGIGTVVLQSGEDDFPSAWLARIIEKIKERFSLAVTLSVGERSRSDFKDWKEAGADRYLMRIESSDQVLYESLHQGRSLQSRLECLDNLRELGYQVGSGIMVGFPGQTLSHIAQDIRFFCERNFDMIGIGPFIPHAQTAFCNAPRGDLSLTLKTIALTRIATRNAWLPATTALGSLDRDCRLDGLQAGANVIMPNFTASSYKKKYEIYPNKQGVNVSGQVSISTLSSLAQQAGLTLDCSRCDSLKKTRWT